MRLSASSRILLILSLLALILLGLVLVTGGKEAESDDQAVRLFAGVTIDAVEIDLDAGRSYRLKKRTDGWYLSEPIESRADEEMVRALTSLIEQMVAIPLEYDRSEGTEALGAFGIGTEGQFRLGLHRAAGGLEEILIGKEIPLDVGYVYAWEPAEEKLYKVQREVRELLDRSLFEMRNKRLTFLAADDVTAVAIETAEAPLRLEMKGEWWEITEPLKAPADGSSVEALIHGLTALRSRDFPKPETVEGSILRVTLRTRDGEKETIGIGNTYDGGLTVVETDIPGGPFGVESSGLEGLPLALEDFKSKSILRYRAEEIAAVYIASPENEFSLNRREDGWFMDTGYEVRADSGFIGRLLEGLLQVEGEPLPEADNEDLRQRSLFRIVLEERTGRKHTLWLAPDGDGNGRLRGVSSFRDAPFTVQGALPAALPLSPGQFEDRHMLYFDPREIEAFEYTTLTERIRAEKRGNDWFITRPLRTAADKPVVWRLLFAAENLTFIRREPAAPEGLVSGDSIDLSLFSADGEQVSGLKLYTPNGSGEVYAESSDRTGWFLIDSSFVSELPAGSGELSFTR
jgi:Domain of unknown function (DUF4340)